MSVDGIARITRANNFTVPGNRGSDPIPLDSRMLKAIYTGLLSDKKASPVFECSTGNCTFPSPPDSNETYQTLAIESDCVNITDEVEVNRTDSTIHYFLPQWGNYTTGTEADFLTLLKTNASDEGYQFPSYWPADSEDSSIFSFAALMYAADWEAYNSTALTEELADYIRPFAVECSLWPVVQTISGHIEQAEVEEQIISSERLRTRPGNVQVQFIDMLHISRNALQQGKWQPCSPSATFGPDTPIPIVNNSLWAYDPYPGYDAVAEWYSESCIWYIDSFSRIALLDTLNTLYDNQTVELFKGIQNLGNTMGEIWIRDMYGDGNFGLAGIQGKMALLAASITAQLRANAAFYWNTSIADDKPFGTVEYITNDRAYVKGVANETATCVQVQWAWLAYPASLVILTLAFVALSAWKTRRRRTTQETGLWKSTSLAVLFGGLDEAVRQKHGTINHTKMMQAHAEELKVSLQPTESGWRLVESREPR